MGVVRVVDRERERERERERRGGDIRPERVLSGRECCKSAGEIDVVIKRGLQHWWVSTVCREKGIRDTNILVHPAGCVSEGDGTPL